MKVDNKELARVLWETADLMEIAAEDGFRIRSYRNGATAIEGHPESIGAILKDPARKVTDIPGIGKGLAAVLREIEDTGSCERRNVLLAKYPATALEFLKIQGLRPKSIALLFEHFHVTTMDELDNFVATRNCATSRAWGPNWKKKSSARSRNTVCARDDSSSASPSRRPTNSSLISTAMASNRSSPPEVCGAGAKLSATSICWSPDPTLQRLWSAWPPIPGCTKFSAGGVNKTSVKLGREGLQVDVRALPRESFGAAMQYFTGSKEHNVAVRQRAVRMGLKLSEYGLFRIEDESVVAGETEEGVYQALGLSWVPPEMRENLGEIELAAEGCLPELVELGQIRGDLHMHTTETDGRASLEEMAQAARDMGYEYIAITDHSKSLAMTNGLDEARVSAFAARVRRINADGGLGIRIFSGIECDIMRDGAMDLAWDALAELDFVIGSVHNNMNMEAAEMNDRLLRALECPSLRVFGHLTGRLLLNRDPYPFDFERIVDEAVKRGVMFEINSSPERLDLSANMARTARIKGAKFVINTDAHHPKHLANMRYGVATARRAWLAPGDVLNTLPVAEFAARMSPAAR